MCKNKLSCLRGNPSMHVSKHSRHMITSLQNLGPPAAWYEIVSAAQMSTCLINPCSALNCYCYLLVTRALLDTPSVNVPSPTHPLYHPTPPLSVAGPSPPPVLSSCVPQPGTHISSHMGHTWVSHTHGNKAHGAHQGFCKYEVGHVAHEAPTRMAPFQFDVAIPTNHGCPKP